MVRCKQYTLLTQFSWSQNACYFVNEFEGLNIATLWLSMRPHANTKSEDKCIYRYKRKHILHSSASKYTILNTPLLAQGASILNKLHIHHYRQQDNLPGKKCMLVSRTRCFSFAPKNNFRRCFLCTAPCLCIAETFGTLYTHYSSVPTVVLAEPRYCSKWLQ